jgi:DnaK suppressor protein
MTNITPIKPAKQPKYMGPPMLNEFRQILATMKNKFTGQLRSIMASELDLTKTADDNDMASKREAASLEVCHLERNARRVNQIDAALVKIDSGEYGYCAECGDEIGVNRLRAQPIADLCIPCKETAEKTEHRFSTQRAA